MNTQTTFRKPTAILKQAQAADAAIEQLRAQSQPQSPAVAPPVQPPAEPQPLPPPEADDGAQGMDDGAPVSEGLEDDGGAPPVAAEPQSGEVYWEQRFRVLQGKYNAETKRDRDTITTLQRDMDSLRGVLATVQTQLAAKPAEPPKPAPAPTPKVTQKEIEEYGEDLLDAASRFAAQQWEPIVVQLRSELSDLRAEVASTKSTAVAARQSVAMSAREQMFATLDKEITDWRAINTDDQFKEWLGQEDEMSGETRQTLLLRAYERNDAKRVMRFFASYKAEHAGGSQPAPAGQPAADPGQQPTGKPRVDPAQFVAPARGRSAPRPVSTQQIVWTPADIAAFYSDVQRGLYKKNPQERDRLERDIFDAQATGRVQPN
jgi:hypothetical protein